MGNIEQLRGCIEFLISNQHLLPLYGAAGRKRVEDEFNSEAHYMKIQEIYQSLLYPHKSDDPGRLAITQNAQVSS
jgi:hypothetical protein